MTFFEAAALALLAGWAVGAVMYVVSRLVMPGK
jgi:hypothetical protein